MRIAAKLGVAIGIVALLTFGVWFLGAIVATAYLSAIALGAAWILVCGVGLELAGRRRPALRWTVRGTLAVFAVVGAAALYWTTVRETVVDEEIVTGVPASRLAPSERGAVDPLAPQP
jgi:hypothetical protein